LVPAWLLLPDEGSHGLGDAPLFANYAPFIFIGNLEFKNDAVLSLVSSVNHHVIRVHLPVICDEFN
jgi:hypothetical protein